MLYQLRTLHKKRFSIKLGELDTIDIDRVKEKLETLLELSHRHPTEAEIEGNNPKSNTSVDETDTSVNIEK